MSDITNVDIDDVSETTPVLDVRDDYEWVAGHIPGALHIPMNDIPMRLNELDPDVEYRVICLRGGRSSQVVAWLNAQGYEAVNVRGSMTAWSVAGRPLVSETGETPYVIGADVP